MLREIILQLILAAGHAQQANVPKSPPPVYVPICLPGHPKCNRPYPPQTKGR